MFQGYWQTTIGYELKGKRLGIIGLGKIGSQVAKIGQAFGMEVSAWSENLNLSEANKLNVLPTGTEGYKTAEVTLGGIDTNEINSATMECKKYSGLYFIGEVVDVTGHLGGHNFQWAWSSGYVAGQNV